MNSNGMSSSKIVHKVVVSLSWKYNKLFTMLYPSNRLIHPITNQLKARVPSSSSLLSRRKMGYTTSLINGAARSRLEEFTSSNKHGGNKSAFNLSSFMLLPSILGVSSALLATQQEQTSSSEEAPPLVTDNDNDDNDDEEETTTVINWSGTHTIEVPNKHYYEPESISELQSIVTKCHEQSINIRPVGSALSPNAISFQPKGMISMANLDQILNIDKTNMTITVQAGARVSQVVDALRPHGLTLPNLASIAEQQMGGFVQIGAHGTGANIPPVDDFVRSITLVTPSRGTVTLDSDNSGEMFHLAKVGLGCLGVVSEITMDCIPSHRLFEHTYVLTRKEAKKNLNDLLKKHKHVRYMWIPYEDAVVVVTNDPEDEHSEQIIQDAAAKEAREANEGGGIDKMKPLKDLLKMLSEKAGRPLSDESINEKGFGELRDALLAFDPLNGDHVKLVNKAEADFWKQSEGYQLKPSDELLQFDCGGQVSDDIPNKAFCFILCCI